MANSHDWRWGWDKVLRAERTRTIYYIYRPRPYGMFGITPRFEYLHDKTGKVRTWRTVETVKRALANLLEGKACG
jgi:hypothetical protein